MIFNDSLSFSGAKIRNFFWLFPGNYEKQPKSLRFFGFGSLGWRLTAASIFYFPETHCKQFFPLFSLRLGLIY
ncbi:MAG: hypothetical protein IJQ11_00445 [Bacteroidales bacterium]|nr:hypothetical protein [Bacteroidales bacterium]